MAVKLISKKKRSLALQVTGTDPYGPIFLNLIWHPNPLSKYTEVRGPPDLYAVAHRLRTSDLQLKFYGINLDVRQLLVRQANDSANIVRRDKERYRKNEMLEKARQEAK